MQLSFEETHKGGQQAQVEALVNQLVGEEVVVQEEEKEKKVALVIIPDD